MKLYFTLPKILELLDINIQFNIFNIIYGLPFAVLGLSLAAYGFILMGKKIGKILTFKPVKGMVVGYARDDDGYIFAILIGIVIFIMGFTTMLS